MDKKVYHNPNQISINFLTSLRRYSSIISSNINDKCMLMPEKTTTIIHITHEIPALVEKWDLDWGEYAEEWVYIVLLCQYLVLHRALVACHPLCPAPPCWVVGRPMNEVFVHGANPRTGSLCSPPSPFCPGPCTCWTKAQRWTFNPFSFEQYNRSLLKS